MVSKRNWPRQKRTGALDNTETMPDSWMLVENYGQYEGRITLQTAGPDKGKWLWRVLLDRDGEARRLEVVCATGREAKLTVEALVPKVVVRSELDTEIEDFWTKRGFENLARAKKRRPLTPLTSVRGSSFNNALSHTAEAGS